MGSEFYFYFSTAEAHSRITPHDAHTHTHLTAQRSHEAEFSAKTFEERKRKLGTTAVRGQHKRHRIESHGRKKQIISSRDKQPDYPYKSAQFFKSSPKNDRDQVCTKRTYSKGSWISDSAPKREKSKRYTDGDRFFIVLDSLLSSKDSQNVFCIAPKFRTDYLSQTGDCQKKIFYVFSWEVTAYTQLRAGRTLTAVWILPSCVMAITERTSYRAPSWSGLFDERSGYVQSI